MANPNQYSTAEVTSLVSVTEMGILTTAQVVILTTAAVSALHQVTNFTVTNLSTAQVSNLTTQLWPQITMAGTPRVVGTAQTPVPTNTGIVVIDKSTPLNVDGAKCLSAAGSVANVLEYIISYDKLGT